ncbi:MAG TPA: hypothetical protein VFG73_01485 [Rhodanobacteraceae bacterium]|nr:hypothetical protein [Rhodanobacteraceae bacterium]
MKNPTVELFESYKSSLGVRTDCAAAESLGVKNQTVNNWRSRGSQAEPRLLKRMCTKLKLDPAEWILRAQMTQTPDPKNKQIWRGIAKQFGYKIALVAAPLASMLAAQLASGQSGLL